MARRKTPRKQVKAREARNTFIIMGAFLLLLALGAMHATLPTILTLGR